MRKGIVRRVAAGLLSFLLLFASACGSKSENNDVIKIGANLELSGNVATLGQSGLNGIMLAVDEINNAGGVLGKKIEIVKYDNKSDNTEAASVATRLITQDKVVAIIGSMTSGNTLSYVNIAETNKVPVISPSATNPDVTVDPKQAK